METCHSGCRKVLVQAVSASTQDLKPEGTDLELVGGTGGGGLVSQGAWGRELESTAGEKD